MFAAVALRRSLIPQHHRAVAQTIRSDPVEIGCAPATFCCRRRSDGARASGARPSALPYPAVSSPSFPAGPFGRPRRFCAQVAPAAV